METSRNEKNKILEVKNLRISFKTNGGTVKAVRGIDFSLYRGKVLAIVGESGSGKSVTSKAVLGILANNKIVEDGQIIFDGKDLLKLSEDEFTKIRGVKISMIFQDPLSSLDPIITVGKQLTEAMVLKNKASRKEASAFIRRIDSAMKRLLPGEANRIQEFGKALSKNGSAEEGDIVTLFQKAYVLAQDERKENVNRLLPEVEAILEGWEGKDFAAVKASIRGLYHHLPSLRSALSYQSDNVVDVFKTVCGDYFSAIERSKKLLRQREAILKRFGKDDIFDLPPSQRANMQEVVIEPEEYIKNIRKTVENFLARLREIAAMDTQHAEKRGSGLFEAYKKNAIEKVHVLSAAEAKERALALLKDVGIPEPERRFNQYPFEFSGGMRQRIVIAIALSSNPDILICDEPTTALDVTIQAQILELIKRLKEEKNLSIIFITHDLGVVANMADDIAVMYAGKIVEYGTVYDIFYDPRHPYTWALLGSMPDLKTKEKLNAIPGTPPNMLLPPKGDAFAARNKFAVKEDFVRQPPYFQVSSTHYAATWLLHPEAPDVQAPAIVSKRIAESLEANGNNRPEPDNRKNSILNYIGGEDNE